MTKRQATVSLKYAAAIILCLLKALTTGSASAASDTSLCGTCYEIFVYSFCDSDGDGIGDLPGVLEKLDYINDGDPETDTDLNCSMIWLMPVFSSPTYHKYDVTDYMSVDPQYTGEKTEDNGLAAFDSLVSACHERGISLILDLPLNHTSSQHPWFLEAASYLRELENGSSADPADCPYIDYYHFSIFLSEGFVPLEGTDWFYEARFWSGMPDLNLDSPAVRGEIEKITDFWLRRGADGFRLDAVTSYYTENKPANISFLRWLHDTTSAQKENCYLVGEAWTDLQTYASYYESGIDSLFDFAFAGPEGYIAALTRGKRPASWYGKKLMEEEALFASYSDHAVNAPFYTNHDMARSAGYYTRDDGRCAKMALLLNLMMPGNCFLYYGEELGMKGSGSDENKRAPFLWSSDPAEHGMCAGPPEMEEISMKYGSLEEQAQDPQSIYSFVKHAIRVRTAHPAIALGKTDLITRLSGKQICAFLRNAENEESVLLIFNMGDGETVVDLEKSAKSREYLTLSDSLCAAGGEVLLEGSELQLPGRSLAVLKR